MADNNFELTIVEEVDNKQYRLPDYLDLKNYGPDTFLANFAKFLPMYIGGGRPTEDTMAAYETSINLYLKWCRNEAKAHPFAIQDFQFRLYVKYLNEKQHLAPATVRLKIAAIRAFYDMSVKIGFIKSSPCELVPLPPLNDASDEDFVYYTIEQLGEICKTFKKLEPTMRARNTLMVYLMGVEGLRRVEVVRLNDEDINYEKKTILIRGKGRNALIYPCDATMDALVDYVKKRGPVEKEGEVTPTIISFAHNNWGKRITRDGVRKVVNRALTIAGLKYYGHACHTLRHSCGTNLYRETKDIRVVQETLRHKSPVMTARYSHVDERSAARPTRNIAPKLND